MDAPAEAAAREARRVDASAALEAAGAGGLSAVKAFGADALPGWRFRFAGGCGIVAAMLPCYPRGDERVCDNLSLGCWS